MTAAPGAPDLEKVLDELRGRAPELLRTNGPLALDVHLLAERRRCWLYGVVVRDGTTSHDVLVKLRREAALRPPGAQDRPEMAPRIDLTEPERTRLEFEGLQVAAAAARSAGSTDVAAVQPLFALEQERAVVMERVSAPTLRDRIDARARPGGPDTLPLGPSWTALGRWLRAFQQVPESTSRGERLTDSAELVDLIVSFSDYLTGALGRRPLFDRISRSASVLHGVLPSRLPTALGHADFAPRNVFVDDAGRVRVFDPMPVWRAPVHEDLARMIVNLRLGRLRVATRGRIPQDRVIAADEQALVLGYAGPGGRPVELDVLCVLVALDQWTSLVHQAQRLPGPAASAAARWTAGAVEPAIGSWLDRLQER